MLGKWFGNNLVLGSREHGGNETRRRFERQHPDDGERCRWRDILAWGRFTAFRCRRGGCRPSSRHGGVHHQKNMFKKEHQIGVTWCHKESSEPCGKLLARQRLWPDAIGQRGDANKGRLDELGSGLAHFLARLLIAAEHQDNRTARVS
jgi:hypothetical protein